MMMEDATEDNKPLLNINNDDIEIDHKSVTLSVSLDIAFVKSPRAPLIVLNALFLFLGWCFCAVYKSEHTDPYKDSDYSYNSFLYRNSERDQSYEEQKRLNDERQRQRQRLHDEYKTFESYTDFFMFASIFPWVYQIILFAIFITGMKRYYQKWIYVFHFFLFFNCLLWASLLLISSRMIAYAADRTESYNLQAAASFGFLGCICFIGESQLYLLEFYRSKQN